MASVETVNVHTVCDVTLRDEIATDDPTMLETVSPDNKRVDPANVEN